MKIKEYLDWKATYAPRASTNYRIWLERFDGMVQKDISDVGVGDIVKYKNWLTDHYQPKTTELAMIAVGNFFKFWKLQGVNCISPELIKIPKARANSYQPISFEEYISILSFIHPTNFWELQKLIIVRLLFETGMRVSELCDLNVSDFDPEKMFAIIKTKKTYNVRKIFWSMETHIFIKEFLKQRKIINSEPAFFIGRHGIKGTPTKRLTTRSVQRMIKQLCDRAGIIKKISPHSFRHGKAHRVLELGGNPKDIQAILGHCDPSSSFTYLQWNDKEFEKRAKMFLK